MNFRTEIKPVSTDIRISHRSRVVMLGSCFSDNIGSRLRERMFHVEINPLGTVYNPASIAETVSLITSGRTVCENELFQHEGLWRHFLCHTSLARTEKSEAAGVINRSLDRVRKFIGSAEELVVIITLGTARVYERDGRVVSNCHKLPAAQFTRRLMDVDESAQAILGAIRAFGGVCRSVRVILTVSPIRHKECGLDGNSLSKAILRVACQKIVDACAGTLYFPAFEALVDDLRDYRFYQADMMHPSDVAADYVYSLFEESVMDQATRMLGQECLKITRRRNHRRLTDTLAAELFEQETTAMMKSLLAAHPELCDVSTINTEN
ncbi:MAG: GSCFA domain-containing protein [Muribaculaceae bacterium]|nr:GSCFA domain-containing protein [Muribaculaceae bacterium]